MPPNQPSGAPVNIDLVIQALKAIAQADSSVATATTTEGALLVAAINALTTALSAVFPTIGAGTVTTTATAGTNGATPAQVYGYLEITLPSIGVKKIPLYDV